MLPRSIYMIRYIRLIRKRIIHRVRVGRVASSDNAVPSTGLDETSMPRSLSPLLLRTDIAKAGGECFLDVNRRGKIRSECELEADLYHAGRPGTDHRVARSNVGCIASASECAGTARVISQQAQVRGAVGVCVDGVVERVEHFESEFGGVSIMKLEVLEDGQVHILEARIPEDIPAHGAIRSKCRRNHHRVSSYVATTGVQRVHVGGGRQTLGPEGGGGPGVTGAGTSVAVGLPGASGGLRALSLAGTRAEHDGLRTRLEVTGISNEVPAVREVGQRVSSGAEGMSLVEHQPGHCALQGDDRIELPTFQYLAKAILGGKVVSDRRGETVPNIKVAAAVLRGSLQTVLRRYFIQIQGTRVETMTIGVTNQEIQTMRRPLGHSDLQAVVVGDPEVIQPVDDLQIGEFGAIGTDAVPAGVGSALVDIGWREQVTAQIADVLNVHREIRVELPLDAEVVIDRVGNPQIRIHCKEAAR